MGLEQLERMGLEGAGCENLLTSGFIIAEITVHFELRLGGDF